MPQHRSRSLSLAQRHPWSVVAAWLIFVLLAAGLGTQLGEVVKAGGFNDARGPSMTGAQLGQEVFGDPRASLTVVLSSTGPIEAEQVRLAGQAARVLPEVTEVLDSSDLPALGAERVQVLLVGIDADNTRTQNLVPRLREEVAAAVSVDSHVTGAAALDYDLNIQSQEDALSAEMIAFPLLVVILLLVYRAVVPTVATLAVAGVCLAGTHGVGVIAARLTDVSNMYITAASLIGLAVSVDYCLFLLSRYREFRQSADPSSALASAVATAGHSVRFGGLSVIAALCALFLARNMVFSSIALAGIIVTLIALAALATLLPAIITLLGSKVFAGGLPARLPGVRLRKGGAGLPIAQRRPVLVALAVAVPLALLAAPLAWIDLQVPVASASILPREADSRAGIEAIDAELDARALFPTQVIFSEDSADMARERAEDFAARVAEDPEVTQVRTAGPVTRGSTAYSRVLLTAAHAPDTAEAHELIDRLRAEDAIVSGATAQGSDFDRLVEKTILPIIATVALISLALLGRAFGSWRLSLLAVALNALVVAGALGALAWGWQGATGAPINSVTPLVIFAIIFGLSMDYMVLMVSRMKEERRAGASHERAIKIGLHRTSGLIISAALIMIGVFASFTVAEISIIRELGLGLALAVALDALIVRPFGLPAILTLAGERVWGREATGERPGEASGGQ